MNKQLEKRWEIPPQIPNEIDERLINYPPIFRQILFNRGIHDFSQAQKYLDAEEIIYDPILLKDMDIAINKIVSAINEKKKILVFGDYDADGVTATALLVQVLRRFTKNVEKFIPNRFDEGYGFSDQALDEVLKQKPDLLITVDCGVRSIKEVERARSEGLVVIISDHHQPYAQIPEADAIICPKQPGDLYPFKDLSGVGIAYKIVCALQENLQDFAFNADDWLDLVAIGTIADLAPLKGENRMLVRRGIEKLRKVSRPGIRALAVVSSVNPTLINARDIGFMIAPRLNAAGRLSTAENAFNILIEEDLDNALVLAQKLDRDNKERQSITREIYAEVEKIFLASEKEWLMFYASEEFNEGVVGLAASRLVEHYYRPAVIGSINGDIIRASCRSIKELNITTALDQCADLLVKHGGHAMAAGLTLRRENAELFSERLGEIIKEELCEKEIMPVIHAEMEVGLSLLHPTLLELLNSLEPCGEGNPAPLFVSRNLEILDSRTMGANGDHIKINVRNCIDDLNSRKLTYSAVGFNFGWVKEFINKGDLIDLLFSFEENEFNGRRELQLKICDLKQSGKF